jgi:RNA polymerase sigma-70 factor, ECF subfamily
MVKERSDAELVSAVLGGETDAFGELVRRYQHVYYRFAVRMLGSRDDADDALQSAFVRAYRNLASCREPSRFGAWLYMIVINECRTGVIARQRREARFVHDEDSLDVSVEVEESGMPQDLETIQRALERLPPDQREAFVLKHVEELEYDEMAGLTGVSVSALKMRVKRARERLKQLLEPARSAR